ncbi:MAG: tyrosine-type recombinase/integrase [Verrucomicrobiota bacterium]
MRVPFRLKRYNDSNRPTLKFVVNFRENGQRTRRFFETKRGAETFVQQKTIELQNQGREGVEFPSWLRIMAGECNDLLEPFGKTIRHAVDHYVTFLRASAKSCIVSDLAEQMLIAKKADGVSTSHFHDLKCRLKKFCADFGNQNAATVSTREVDGWLRGLDLAPQGRNNYRSALRSLFNFAVKRSYATTNPAASTEKAKVVSGPPGILTVAQTVALLNACEADTLPFVAISLFAGLRAAEMEKLDWSEVDLEGGHIEVTAKKAKTARRRLIGISENLAAWIRPHAAQTGSVAPVGLRKRFDAVKLAAGLSEWPPNAMRHSFASYRLAQCQDAARVSLEMGNSPQMIFAHYRELVKPKEAERYWKIKPE